MAAPTQKTKAAPAPGKKPATAQRARKPEAARPPAYMQAKLAVSHPQDSAEKEADHVARQVARTPKAMPPAPQQASDKKAQRASLEPAITPEKRDTLALKPVPAARNIRRRAKPTSATPEKKPEKKKEEPSSLPGKNKTTNVQRQAADAVAGAPVSAEAESRIEARRGSGAILPDAPQKEMEGKFGQDFSHVRIHNDSEAADLCAETSARAFTVGNDIFFAPGEFAPDTDTGRELLAHELTHVIQQDGGVQRLMREPAASSVGSSTVKGKSSGGGKGELDGNALLISAPLSLPNKPGMAGKFKKGDSEKGWKLPKGTKSADAKGGKEGSSGEGGGEKEARTNQRNDWTKQIKSGLKVLSENKYFGINNLLPKGNGTDDRYALKPKKGGKQYLLGTKTEILERAALPWWDDKGSYHSYDVDHILELQLGGAASDPDNFQLLDSSANRSSGSRVRNAINKAISDAIPPKVKEGATLPSDLAKTPSQKAESDASSSKKGTGAPTSGEKDKAPSELDLLKGKYDVYFKEVNFDGEIAGEPNSLWLYSAVQDGQHFSGLEMATKSNSPELYDDDKLKVFPKPGVGSPLTLSLGGKPNDESLEVKKNGANWRGMTITSGSYNRESGSGTIFTTLTSKATDKVAAKKAKDVPLNIVSSGIPMFSHIQPGAIAQAYKTAFEAKMFSPIVLNDADLDTNANIVGGGVLTIEGIPLLAGTTFDISLVDGDLVFSKTFSTDEFDVKGPIQFDSSSLTLAAGAATPIAASGLVEFHIGELAKGSLKGHADANSFGMSGQLELDKQLFTGAGTIDYDSKDGMKASGTLGLKQGVLKGVKKATFKLAYDDSKKALDFSGDADLSVPGFKGAKLAAHADDAGNISLGGEATLSDSIPRIKSGKLNVSAERKGDVWSLGGGGELEPDLAGLDASAKVKLDYKDGLLNGKLTANYKRSMVEGNVDLNARAVIGEGGGEAEPLKVWGGGKVGVTAAPWLKATVGLALDEKGEVTVAGEMGLPSSLEIFPRKEVNKSLFSLSTQIPIIPGIVAEVGGNLSAKAGIGPGALDQLKLGIVYNPDREENTHITGKAHVNVPADAGLRLAARAGIGLGITGASATGGLELGGALGIAGAAEASAHIDWKPSLGLQINTEGYLHAEPKFKFDVSGYVAVTALGFSVYDNRWELAAYELGSNLRLGVRFPINYREGQPFNLSLDNVQFEVPQVDPAAMVRDLGNRIF